MIDPRTYLDYLRDMLEASESAEEFAEGLEFEQLATDRKTLFAVVKALEIIGEASRHIPLPVQLRYSAIPWRDIASMRNRLIHGYFNVNVVAVWQTLKEDIPALKPLLAQAIADVIQE